MAASTFTKGGASALYRPTTLVLAIRHWHVAPQRFPRISRLGLVLLGPLLLALTALPVGAESTATVLPTDGAVLRANPGADQRPLDTIPAGVRLTIVAGPTGDDWYQVQYRGLRGWVLGSTLHFDDAAAAPPRRALVLPADGLNLRAGPERASDLLGTLPTGSAVTVLGRPTTDGWVQVQSGSRVGWVLASFLNFDVPAAVVLAPPPAAIVSAGPGATRGLVRYYGAEFDGGRMACGGVYRADDPGVAAAVSWPCGTVLRVCTTANCLIVTVRDRGLMGPGEIDLAPAGFARLGPLYAGVLSVTVETIGP